MCGRRVIVSLLLLLGVFCDADRIVSAATVPGAIPGHWAVGSQGEATYSIPIAAPAGTGGLKANVALRYNHLSGNGLAGMRWTLSGISAITRCQQTFAQDGLTFPVNNSNTDRFCLEGRRLVLFSGTQYGWTGSEYRTEIETFQRIIQTGPLQGGGPQSFRVDHPDGTSSYYGMTEDSRGGMPGGVVTKWYISYAEDQFGNRVSYTYDKNTATGEHVPVEISWTHNPAQGLAPQYRITITYEPRPADDVRTGFDGGGVAWTRSKRIDRIDVLYGSTQVINTYELTYGSPSVTGTGRSQLVSVSLCGPTDCLPPTTFEVQNGTRGWVDYVVSTPFAGSNTLIADQSGEGRSDAFASFSGTWLIYYGAVYGNFENVPVDTGASSATNPDRAQIVDYNGDGRADLLFQSGSTWRVLQQADTPTATVNIDTGISTAAYPVADIRDHDGDGLDDWIFREAGSIKWMRNTGSGFAAPQTIWSGFAPTAWPPVLDVNSDGRDDELVSDGSCFTDSNGWKTCNGPHYVRYAEGSASLSPFGPAQISNVRSIDVNGDHLDDVAYVAGGTWRVHLSRGNSIGTAIDTGIPSTNADKVLIVDYDNDGRVDLLRPSGDYWLIHRSSSSGLPSVHTDSFFSEDASASGGDLADVNGDGFPEILRPSLSGGYWLHAHNSEWSEFPDVVKTFTNGLGYSIDVMYMSIGNQAQYTWDDTLPAIDPPYIRRFGGARYVVSVEIHNSEDGTPTEWLAHEYDTAVIDVSGRGWLSFNYHTVRDAQQIFTKTVFNQTFPFAGMVEEQSLYNGGANPIVTRSIVDAVLDKTSWTASLPHRHFVRVESVTTTEREVAGPLQSTVLRTVVDDPAYETSYGTVTHTTRTVTQTTPLQTWQSTTAFNPVNYTTATEWCLGLPGLVETTNTLPDFTYNTRRVRHTFDPADCRLTELRDESDSDLARQSKTTYTYDVYGNLTGTAEDSMDGSAQDRSTTIVYDANNHLPASVTTGGANLTTELTWNYFFAQPASLKGADLLTTAWTYDDFGRLRIETRPVGSTTVSFGDCTSCWPQNARYFMRSLGSDGSDTYEFFDERQRLVGNSWKLPLGTEGRREIRYDEFGRVTQQSQPYVSFDPVFWTTYLYDSWGRLVQEDAPIGESQPSGAITTYEYHGLDVWITDPANRVTKHVYNGEGQLEQVVDALNGTAAYTYRPFGELATVVDPESNTTTISYDARGFKSQMNDPNAGTWFYDYNVYGELVSQTNAMGNVVTFTYDQAGRPATRTEPNIWSPDPSVTTYEYHAAGAGAKGKLQRVVTTLPSSDPVTSWEYSSTSGAPTLVHRWLNGKPYDYDLSYDSEGRLDVLTYPVSSSGYRFKADYDYDSWGYVTAVKDGNTGASFYALQEADALGRDVLAQLGNGLDEYREFDRASGNLSLLQTGPSLGSTIQDVSFTWDEVGNLESRTNFLIGKTETFTYDALDRLTSAQVSGLAPVTLTYSAAGRITSKSDVGTYTYSSAAHPNAVTNAGGVSYSYDANGRMTNHGGDNLYWHPFDKPQRIWSNGKNVDFKYAFDRQAYWKRETADGVSVDTIYAGAHFEKEIASQKTYRHYVEVGGRVVAVMTRVSSTNTVQYLHRDHQNSVVAVTDASGTLAQALAYDAWGLRRDATTWAPLADPFGGTQATERGYTGHEHLDTVELVNMRGRVQDPSLGMFISPDPFVQAPHHSQSLNRYSYVWNNPTTYVDPSGFCRLEGYHIVAGCTPEYPDPSRIPGNTDGLDDVSASLREFAEGDWGWVDQENAAIDSLVSGALSGGGASWTASGGSHSGPPVGPPGPPVGPPQGAPPQEWGAMDTVRLAGEAIRLHWRDILRDSVQGARDHSLGGEIFTDYLSPVGGLVDSGIPCAQGDVAACVMVAMTLVTRKGGNPSAAGARVRHTPDQKALKELVDEATMGGRKPLSVADAETVLDWADEVRYPGARASAGDVAIPSNWTSNPVPHIHLPGAGRGGHVPVEPGVRPR